MDTNGAGDAFAGGFVGAMILGKSHDEAVEVGHRLGAMCVGQVRLSVNLRQEKKKFNICHLRIYRSDRNSSGPRRKLSRAIDRDVQHSIDNL